MSREIERKFIVNEHFPILPDMQWGNSIYYSSEDITQGYFWDGLTRVRIIDRWSNDAKAFITVKSKRTGLMRYEFEYEIPVEDALHMMELFCDGVIEKKRCRVKEDGRTWEVDIFEEENDGLILAEIELESEDEDIVLPYFIGREVTDEEKYYNKNLSKKPYKKWERLWTSYFSSSEWEPDNVVSIAGKSPSYYNGPEYKKLAPKFWFFEKYKRDGDKEFYTRQYYEEVLDKLDPEEVYNDLGKDTVLLCWEKPGEFCHRHIVANWFKDRIVQSRGGGFEVEVKEIGEE